MNPQAKKALSLLAFGLVGIALAVLLVLSMPLVLAKVIGITMLFAVMILGGALGTAPEAPRRKRKA
jgi:hypothetical protein